MTTPNTPPPAPTLLVGVDFGLPHFDDGLLELWVRTRFQRGYKTAAYLGAIGAKIHDGQHGAAIADAAGGYERDRNGFAHHRNQAERSGFIAAVVPTCFKAFGNNSIYAGRLGFEGKFDT